MNKIRVLPLPVLLFALMAFMLPVGPLTVRAQDIDATPTLELTLIPTEEPTTIPEEPTATLEEKPAEPADPTEIPGEPTEILTETPVTLTDTPTTEPSPTPEVSETILPILTETITVTPTITPTNAADPIVVPLIQPQGVEIIPDRYIVVYKSAGAEIDASIDSVSTLGASVDHTFSSVISGFSASLPPDALIKLRQDPNIAFIEADQVAWLADDITINSVQTSTTWGLDRIDQHNLPLDGNYNYYQSGAGVNVYLMDSGIDTSHPDFGGRASNDFDTVDGGMSDCHGHGTHVAGIIGSSTYGVAKAARIHGVRVTNCEGKGSVSSIIAAVDWITANHIKPAVVNLSYVDGPSDAEDLAITRSIAAGITYVAAAGNDGGNACQFSPSRIPGVITVGATDLTDSAAGYSNQGTCLDIFAPGSDITSTSMGGSIEIRSGTSMAAPHVAGAAALFLQSNPFASPADVTAWLKTTSTKDAVNGTTQASPNRLLYTSPILPDLPAAPILVKPSNGSISNQARPVFSWKITSTADMYTFQLASDHDFATILKEESGNSLTYALDADLTGGSYYWRVRAANSNGDPTPGAWSEPFIFSVDLQGPPAPVLFLPFDKASPVGIPSFTWQPVSGASAYQFMVDDTPDFSSPVLTTPDGSISSLPALLSACFLPTGLLSEIPYYWHVRARDGLGNWGDWSESRKFTIQASIPVSPVSVFPAMGAVFKVNPTLSWNSVAGGVYYEVQIANTVQFTSPIIEESRKPTGIFSHIISTVLPDGTWYWRVRAVNTTGGAGNWSAVRTFIMDTTGPTAPVLLAPSTDFTPLSVPTFTWLGPADARSYQFVLGTSADGGKNIDPLITTPDGSIPGQAAITVTSFRPANLPLETLYYWHIRAFDSMGNPGSWSESRSITLQSSLPSAPVQVSPVNGQYMNKLPAFSWNSASTAETYEVQISNSSVFPASSILLPTGPELTATPVSPLADGIWYWRVRGRNHAHGSGAWSAARTFTMDTQASLAPVPVSPGTGVIRSTPAFVWKVVSTAVVYQFEYGTASNNTINTFSPLYTSPELTTVTHTPPAIPVGMFFWHVRDRDAAGNWSAWSDLRVINMNPPILPAPIPLSPANSSYINIKTPILEWNCMNGASNYEVDLADTPSFSGSDSDTHRLLPLEGTCSTEVESSLLTHAGIWYWRIASVNSRFEIGNFGAASNFILDEIAPPAPILTSPANQSSTLRAIPAFTWSPAIGANAYQFQIDDNGFAGPVLFSTAGESVPGTPITSTSFTPSGLKPLLTYSWRVKARDAAQNWSDWSQSRQFTLLPAIPSAPVTTSPVSGYLTNDPLPKFTWNAVFSGDTYRIQIDSTTVFSKPVINELLSAGILTYTPSASVPDGTYYWRVQAVNLNKEPGAWSAARSFTIDTTAPPPPKLLMPAQNANNLRSTPVFSWTAATGANAYQFQLDDDNSFIDPIISTPGESIPGIPIAVISYKTPALSTLIPYFWRVRSRDAAGNWGDWAEPQTFTILPLIPTAPNLVSPVTSFPTRTSPTLSWSSTALAVDYELAIDDDSRFLSPFLSTKTGNVLAYTPSALPEDGLYYWHVRAINTNKEPGSWSVTRTIIIDTVAPNQVVLLSPLDNATGVHSIPFFTWSTPAGAKWFQFQMDDNGFSDPQHIFFSTPGDTVPGTPITTAYAKPATLSILKLYQWRVRACDAAGNWSNWSGLRAFTLQPGVPLAPVAVSPVSGSITNNVKPVFVVKDTVSILRYEVELTLVSPAGPKTVFDSPTSSITYPLDTLPDGSYYWRARMVNAANEPGPWSGLSLFTVDTQPPAKPVLTAPVNGSANGRVVPVFIWGAVTGAKYYQVEIDDDSAFANPEYSTPGDTTQGNPLTVTAYKPASLTVLTDYYWQVRAIDSAGNVGGWSDPFKITILPSIPGIPVQISPANGVLTNDPTPEFRWNSLAGADHYEIQISTLSTFSSSEQSGIIIGGNLAFTPSTNLLNQGKYYWRVRAVNAKDEPGNWSTVWYFSLDTAAPDAPVLTAPIEDALLAPGMPVFYWSAPAGAVQYQFEYDDYADFSNPDYTSPDGTIPGLTAITTTSFKPPAMVPAVPYYWHVRARDAAGNWGDWSKSRRITVQAPLPGVPVLSSPSDKSFIVNRSPVFHWSSALNGYFYELQISQNSTFTSIIKDEVTLSANQLTLSFPDNLPVGDLFWRVRALNVNGKPGNWSAPNKLTILTGYEFTGDSTGWIIRPGATWTMDGGNLSTDGTGVVNSASSMVIDGSFSEFVYEARIKMGFDTGTASGVMGNDHGLILFGSDMLTAQNEIINGYIFHIGQKMTGPGTGVGLFGIDLVVNGVKKPLTGTGYLSGPVNFNSWNALKVISHGTVLTFYINNIQVYTLANTTYKTGRLGVYSVSHVDPPQVFAVDWARVTAP